DAVYRGLDGTGVRAVVARGFLTRGEENGFPPALIDPLGQVLADVERLRATYESGDGRITFGIAPCLVWMVDEAGFRATRAFADATGSLVTYHMAHTPFRVRQNA